MSITPLPDWAPLLCCFIAWVGGGIVSVVTGFGCGLFALPIMLVCISVTTALPVAIVLCCFSMFLVLLKFWRDIDYPEFLFCSLLALPGAWIGVWILRHVSPGLIELAFGLFLILAVVREALVQFMARGRPIHCRALEGALAFIAGLINGVSGMGGPAMGVYAALAHWDKDMARGTFGLFFGVNILLCVILLLVYQMLGSMELKLVAAGMPGALLGTLAGIPLAASIPQKTFMRLLLLVISISGLVLVYKGVLHLS